MPMTASGTGQTLSLDINNRVANALQVKAAADLISVDDATRRALLAYLRMADGADAEPPAS